MVDYRILNTVPCAIHYPFMDHRLVGVKELYNSIKLWAIPFRATQDRWVIVDFWQNVVCWRRKWQPTPVLLPGEPHGQYEKVKKRYDTRRWAPKARRCPICSWEAKKAITNSSIRMKQLGQSRNNTQLWMCLMMKVKSNAVKNNIAQEPGMLGPWIKVNWMWSSRRWQEWTSTS